jgi:hypothetical protein
MLFNVCKLLGLPEKDDISDISEDQKAELGSEIEGLSKDRTVLEQLYMTLDTSISKHRFIISSEEVKHEKWRVNKVESVLFD